MNLMQMSLSAAAMILAIIVLRALTIEKLPKKTFVVLWWVVLLRLVVPFSIPSALSIYSLLPMPTAPLSTAPLQMTPVQTVSEWTEQATQTEQSDLLLPEQPTVLPEQTEQPVVLPEQGVQQEITTEQPNTLPPVQSEQIPPDSSAIEAAQPNLSLRQLLGSLWMTGSGIMAVVFAVSYLRSIREFRMSLPVENRFLLEWQGEHSRRKIEVRQFDRIHTPLTYGILRPVILLPKEALDQDEDTLRFILTHEYVHIRRFDCVTKLLMAAALCLHWCNPLVWAMYLLFNRDLELSCDETVLRLLGRSRRSDYALTLIAMEENRSNFGLLYSGFSRNAIEERIRAIMKTRKASVLTVAAAVVLVVVITVVFATSAGIKEDTSSLDETADDTISQNILDPALYTDYEPYGLQLDTDNNKLYYQGQVVRCFDDQWPGDNQNTMGIGYCDPTGIVDVRAERTDSKLTGLVQASAEEFAARKLSDPMAEGESEEPVIKNADGVYVSLDLEEYKQYEPYGLSYQKEQNVFTYEGELVRYFYDKEAGNSFTNFYTGKVDLEAVRDSQGKLTGLEHSSQEEYDRRTKEIAQMNDSVTATEEADSVAAGALTASEQGESSADALAAYADNGLRYDEQNDRWLYQNRPVRALIDRQNDLCFFDYSGAINLLACRKTDGSFYKWSVLSDDETLGLIDTSPAEYAREQSMQRIHYVGIWESQPPYRSYTGFGLTTEEDGKLWYEGEPVRYFVDGYTVETHGPIDDPIYYKTSTSVGKMWASGCAVLYEYYDPEGTADLYTVLADDVHTIESIERYDPQIISKWTFRRSVRSVKKPNVGAFEALELQTVAEQYAAQGLSYNYKDNRLYFNGQLVRCWMVPEEGMSGAGGELLYYLNDCGVVDIRTVLSADTNGNRTEQLQAFDAGDTVELAQTITPDSGTITSQNLVEARAKKYSKLRKLLEPLEEYGVTYRSGDMMTVGTGEVFYQQKPVKVLVDTLGETSWCYASNLVDGTVSLQIVRDPKTNQITGVEQFDNEQAMALFEQQSNAVLIPSYQSPVLTSATQQEGANQLSRLYYGAPGDRVTAAVGGRVISAGWQAGRGNQVQILDDSGVTWVYSHLQSVTAVAGSVVETGDQLGTVGNTGWASGYYLELEMWYAGQPVDLNQQL